MSGKSGHSEAKSFGQQCVAAPESKSIQGSVSSKVDATKCSSKATSLKVVFKFLRPRSPTLNQIGATNPNADTRNADIVKKTK